MTFQDAVRLALSALRGSILRTMLTILGLSVGVGAVLTVLTLGDSGEMRVEEEIAKLGVNKVWIRSKGSQYALHPQDSKAMTASTGAPACASAYTAAQVLSGDMTVLTQIAGFDERFEAVYAPKLLAGRMFTADEFRQGSTVCLIDEALADILGNDILSNRIRVGHRRLCVVGIIKGLTAQSMSAGSGLIVMPFRTYQDTLGGRIAEITLSVQNDQSAKAVSEAALSTLQSSNGYRADTLEKEINAAREVVRIFVMVLICVAAVCMLTGGIGVMNVLLLAVRERKQEIGLIKAIGGTDAQVCILFLLEAACYALLGGLLGVLLGFAMIHIFSAWIGLNAKLKLMTVLPVLASGAVLGAAFGVAPAIKAARLKPVDALQSH